MSTEIAAERLLSAADGADPEQAARLLFQAFVALSRTADSHHLLTLVSRAQRVRDRSGTAATELIYRTLAGTAATRARRPDGPDHLDRAVRIFDENDFGADPVLVECALTAVMTLMRPEQARRFAPLVDTLVLDQVDRARLLALIGVGDAWAGNLVRGQAELREAARLAALCDSLDVQAEATSWLAKCDALRGDLESAAANLDQARELAARVGSAWVAHHLPECTAMLAFARGDLDAWAGLLELVVATDTGVTAGLQHEHRWELATHHAQAGRPEVAAGLLAGVDDPPRGWPGGTVLPAWRAWILDLDSPATSATLAASLDELTRPVEQLLAARLAWLLGVHHGLAGRRGESARLLERACAGYARTGAAGLLALVLDDLRRLGGSRTTATTAVAPAPADRQPTLDLVPRWVCSTGEPALTGAETRVAAAIADGLSNREAAGRLFVSVKTIEFHLGNIFRKLGVRNRTELAARRARTG
ncbi:LuxR C-terminal-related transcriptional regulator [Micromonospora sp. NPDC000207]|uniref:LuxR C-terminal-related transcriptional regulator n=1 Tax=Micromonospora sp. NPDC000207 TaxID=3154246 RepID=UPI0033220DE2